MYEVEIKIEVNVAERQRLIETLLQRGFTDEGISQQHDYYVKAVESLNNAFDIVRYRREDDKFFRTRKEWEIGEGEPVRLEEEQEISKEDFEHAIAQYPGSLKIFKYRQKFLGSFEGREITFSIDSVKFVHSNELRYFIEPEIITEKKSLVPETREFLRGFTADILGVSITNLIEAPGMFAMAYKKL